MGDFLMKGDWVRPRRASTAKKWGVGRVVDVDTVPQSDIVTVHFAGDVAEPGRHFARLPEASLILIDPREAIPAYLDF